MDQQARSKAPFGVFGGMIVIGLSGLIAVLVSDCRREDPYLDPQTIEKGNPDRVVPPVSPGADEAQRRGVVRPADGD